MPHLFEVLSQHAEDGPRIWLIIASDPGEAGRLVPDPYQPLNCQAIDDNAIGPPRLIGWAGPSRLPVSG